MAKCPAFHTSSTEYPPEHRNVHHDNDSCHDGKAIRSWHRENGTGGKPLCKVCAKF